VLALAVAAGVNGRVLTGEAAAGGMFFSTIPAASHTFVRMGSVSIVVASVALGHSAVINDELTVFMLSIVEQALLHQNVSFHEGPHLQEAGPMCFAALQCLDMPGNMKDFDS
jgi:hypothetical protein